MRRLALFALALAGLLQGVQFGLMSVAANLQLGPSVTMGTRDPDGGPPLWERLGPVGGRQLRALFAGRPAIAPLHQLPRACRRK